MKGVFLAIGLGMFIGGAAAGERPYYINPDYTMHGAGATSCAYVLRVNQHEQNLLDTWADGFITGVNKFSTATPGNVKAKYKLGNIEDEYGASPLAARGVFIRDYCFKNQSNTYADGVAAWVEHIITTPAKK